MRYDVNRKLIYLHDLHDDPIPGRWEICDRCNGDGQHGHPAFDGTTLDSWYEDDPNGESLEAYFRGDYDVRCENGCIDGKVLVPDEERATEEQIQRWDDYWEYQYEAAAERAAERRVGA